MTGAPGRCVLDASTNLTDWQPMTTNVSATGSFSFADTLTTSRPMRMYRAEQ